MQKSEQSSKIQAHKTGGSRHLVVVKVHMYVRTSRIQNPKKQATSKISLRPIHLISENCPHARSLAEAKNPKAEWQQVAQS